MPKNRFGNEKNCPRSSSTSPEIRGFQTPKPSSTHPTNLSSACGCSTSRRFSATSGRVSLEFFFANASVTFGGVFCCFPWWAKNESCCASRIPEHNASFYLWKPQLTRVNDIHKNSFCYKRAFLELVTSHRAMTMTFGYFRCALHMQVVFYCLLYMPDRVFISAWSVRLFYLLMYPFQVIADRICVNIVECYHGLALKNLFHSIHGAGIFTVPTYPQKSSRCR